MISSGRYTQQTQPKGTERRPLPTASWDRSGMPRRPHRRGTPTHRRGPGFLRDRLRLSASLIIVLQFMLIYHLQQKLNGSQFSNHKIRLCVWKRHRYIFLAPPCTAEVFFRTREWRGPDHPPPGDPTRREHSPLLPRNGKGPGNFQLRQHCWKSLKKNAHFFELWTLF